MTEPRLFSRREVAEMVEPAILIIHNVVYDVSAFLDEHPGGHEVLMRVAGQDASEDFDDIGHSSDAKELMKKYVIGELMPGDRVTVTARDVHWADVKKDESGGWQLPALALLVAALVWLYFV